MELSIRTPEPELDSTFLAVQHTWPLLTRSGEALALPLPGRFVKPGGFFKWFFYWDSYFTLVGLVVQGEWQLAREIVENLIYEIEHVGYVPNYNGPRSLCLSRSQSPFLTAAISEVFPFVQDPGWLARASQAAETEYLHYWTVEPHLTETGLSRYIDRGGSECATVPDTPHYRAIGESGWDNTPRFGDDATQVIPVDLNAQLYRYEVDLATFWEQLGRTAQARAWRAKAAERLERINRYLWDEQDGFYWDYDLRSRERLRATPRSLASFMPLWAGAADQYQARRMKEHLVLFEYEHGLVACEKGWNDNTEHNYPTGWPYSHWYVCAGLRRYGMASDATRIALKWLRLVAHQFSQTGTIRERYNVVDPAGQAPGRYPPQRGFAWTNGVYVALLARLLFGIEAEEAGRNRAWNPGFPTEWRGKAAQLCLPDYPWPDGVCLSLEAKQDC
jgi:alpha,alpha-trehalase